ncbi:hypothetical protein Bca52824_088726 [Brassica carinata]|uniref:Uncharacterized protein n=1 Tax=Brassica carinata TaxID=52824 RepID=A0A8X7PEJ5_BRACI|nr:hypothetical protein Bca52824_088726 [Brassica carinata]
MVPCPELVAYGRPGMLSRSIPCCERFSWDALIQRSLLTRSNKFWYSSLDQRPFCLDQGYADRNLIAKWKKGMSVYAACDAYSQETTTMEQHVYVVFPNTCVKRKPLNAFTAVVKDASGD